MDEKFPKAPWLKIKWTGIVKLQGKTMKPMYMRMANASTLYLPLINITWRRAWLPQAAYEDGWDAAYRQIVGGAK